MTSEISATAHLHAHELLRHGYALDRAVHDYGDLCQVITALAFEEHLPIPVDECQTLNRCMDEAIDDLVFRYAYERDQLLADRGAEDRPGLLYPCISK